MLYHFCASSSIFPISLSHIYQIYRILLQIGPAQGQGVKARRGGGRAPRCLCDKALSLGVRKAINRSQCTIYIFIILYILYFKIHQT